MYKNIKAFPIYCGFSFVDQKLITPGTLSFLYSFTPSVDDVLSRLGFPKISLNSI